MDLSQNCSPNLEQGQKVTTLTQDRSSSFDLDLIEKVQNRRFLYDTEDVKHKDKHIVRAAWKDIASELGQHGVDDERCKNKWKSLRDYYRKKKKETKGKSGQERCSEIKWPYYQAMLFLDNCADENNDTISNLEDVVTKDTLSPPSGTEESSEVGENSMTPTSVAIRDDTMKRKPLKKRRLENSMDEVNEKILKFIETPEPTRTPHDKYADRLADRLNKLPAAAAAYACMKIENLMYELEFPQLEIVNNDGYNSTQIRTYEY